MSWLEGKKAEADKEKAAKEAKEAQKQAEWERRHKDDVARASREYQEKFAPLEGKLCFYNGNSIGTFHAKLEDTTITFEAGDTKLGFIRYWQREEEERDDGVSWGTGVYHETSDMTLYLSYVQKDGSKREAQTPKYSSYSYSYSGVGYDDYLGEYLLNFVKL